MSCPTQDITIIKGKTFEKILQWMSSPLIYKPITAITQAAPVAITAPGHGLPNGWFAGVVSVQGMREINVKVPAKGQVPNLSDFYKAAVLDANTIALNEINSLEFSPYVSGGTLVYYAPVSLAGATARLQIRATEESAVVLLDISSASEIVLDNIAKTITITISAAVTGALTFASGVYELEVVAGGKTHQLLRGNVVMEEEIVHD